MSYKDQLPYVSPKQLEEFRAILKKNYGLEPSKEEAREMATNLLLHYRTLGRFMNNFS